MLKSYLALKEQLLLPRTSEDLITSTAESCVSNTSRGSSSVLAASLASSSCLSVAEEYIIHDQQTGLKLVEQRQPSLLGLAMQVCLRDPPDIQGNRMLNLLLDLTSKKKYLS